MFVIVVIVIIVILIVEDGDGVGIDIFDQKFFLLSSCFLFSNESNFLIFLDTHSVSCIIFCFVKDTCNCVLSDIKNSLGFSSYIISSLDNKSFQVHLYHHIQLWNDLQTFSFDYHVEQIPLLNTYKLIMFNTSIYIFIFWLTQSCHSLPGVPSSKHNLFFNVINLIIILNITKSNIHT